MKLALNRRSHRLGAACRTLAVTVAALVGFASTANATNYDGPFSDTASSPTSVSFSLGDNVITGLTGGADASYLTFTIGSGENLSSIILLDGSAAPDRTFFGIASGDTVVVDPSFTSAAGLIGWTLYSDAMDNTDLLGALGLAAPANFPAIPGATGFTPPLGAGTYSIWIEDANGATNAVPFKLDFMVSSAPEPSTWVLMFAGLGLVGGVLRHRSRQGLATA